MSHSEQPNGEVKLWLVKETSGAKWFDSLRKCIPQMVDCTCGKCPGRVPKPLLDGKVEQEARARQEEKAKYEVSAKWLSKTSIS